jgi:WD40 repeat protein
VLVLEPNKHTEMIIRADVDADGRIAATASFDKTIRLWSVADGRLIRTIRVPIGPGNVGRLYAVAISPQADLIAAGGLTRSPELDGVQHIYLFDANSGEMLMRIEGLPAAVRHLVFSPEGRYLAAVLDGSNGLRVYDRELDWAERARDMDYDDTSYMAAFASDGRLATTSNDGWIRLYDRNFELSKRAHTGRDELYGIAFSPDGKRLAVAFYVGTEVAIYDGHTLARLPAPDSYGIEFGNLFAVAWSSSGATLYAAGTHRDDKTSQVMMVIAWDRSGADRTARFQRAQTRSPASNPCLTEVCLLHQLTLWSVFSTGTEIRSGQKDQRQRTFGVSTTISRSPPTGVP